MRPNEATEWQDRLLDEIFRALAAHPPLNAILVFKGARVLDALLHDTRRRSLDIDSNLVKDFVDSTPNREDRSKFLEREISTAISRHFEADSPVRYSLDVVRVKPNAHPRGWDAFGVSVSIIDHARESVRGLPRLHLDIAAPEALRDGSIAHLQIGDAAVWAYTLERIAGEKLRAFLSSLPAHREKLRRPGDVVRVKDVYDLARISRERPTSDNAFWARAGEEFRTACESRLVDCEGLTTFEEHLAATRSAYESDRTLPPGLPFDDAWEALRGIVATLERNGLVPFGFPLDDEASP